MLKKADFYYGAFLSYMINANVPPALLEDSNDRRIYKVTTNKAEYVVYSKFLSKPTGNMSNKRWDFHFSKEEISKIIQLKSKNIIFSLICGVSTLKDSQIAIIKYDDAIKCLGESESPTGNRISVCYEKNRKGLRIYGTELSRKLNGTDNRILIERDIIKKL